MRVTVRSQQEHSIDAHSFGGPKSSPEVSWRLHRFKREPKGTPRDLQYGQRSPSLARNGADSLGFGGTSDLTVQRPRESNSRDSTHPQSIRKFSSERVDQNGGFKEYRLDWRTMFDRPGEMPNAFNEVKASAQSMLSSLERTKC